MKKMLCNIAAIVACTLLLSQCATQDQVTIMQNQLRGLYIKLKDQEETIARLKKEAAMEQLSSVSVIDQVKDESLQHREQMQEDMHRLQTEVERLERSFGSVSAENQQEVTNLSTRVADLNKELDEERRKAQQMEAERRKAQLVAAERRVQAAAEKEKEAKKRLDAIAINQSSTQASRPNSTTPIPVRLTPGTTKKRASVSPTSAAANASVAATSTRTPANDGARDSTSVGRSPANSGNSSPPAETSSKGGGVTPPSNTLNLGIDQYKNKRWQEAYKTFEEVLSTKPPAENAPKASKEQYATDTAKAHFYMGECLYEQKEYDLAILDYQKAITGGSALAPKAQLKQAMSFEKMTDYETAKMIYRQLIKGHGNSPEAKQAQSKLEKL